MNLAPAAILLMTLSMLLIHCYGDDKKKLKETADKEHVIEELQDQINVNNSKTKHMTDEEIQFNYFRVHDLDGNSLLDGLEILKAVLHSKYSTEQDTNITSAVETVDNYLEREDLNNDGYITFAEFMVEH
ncbi:hypothetical protein EB796_024508 [Bugula neritina]|uniref:Follistatin-related protein 1 EF-hand domain-containing protein n=1 Tax=Bugula neritina TaxID=10212 RepID=A0A7J7IVE5_BUGNE|nr:hypothetical protein EB796_024508 [Bugula neritina]